MSENIKKEVLIFGYFPNHLLEQQLMKAVYDFNKANPLFIIEIKEYEDYNQLNKDITIGRAPDIMLLDSNVMVDLYATKGVLVDLYSFLYNDLTIGLEDLQENVLHAYEKAENFLGCRLVMAFKQ